MSQFRTCAHPLNHFWEVVAVVVPSLSHVQARLPCPSLSLGVCSNSCPSSQRCHPAISSSIALFSSCPHFFPPSESFPISRLFTSGGQGIGVSASASVLPRYSGLISFKIDWFDLLAVQGIFKSLLQHLSLKASVLWLSFRYGPTFTIIHDYWKNHSFDYTGLCWESNVSAFKYAV